MKKLAMAMMLGVAALSANAQVNYRMQTACNPQDVKTYDTQRLRSSFMMEKVLVADEINVTYSTSGNGFYLFIFQGSSQTFPFLLVAEITHLTAEVTS